MKLLQACLLTVAMGMASVELEAGEMVIVLDASNSMWGQIEGEAKVTIARQALAGLIDALDAEDRVGLIAYGHRREGAQRVVSQYHFMGKYQRCQWCIECGRYGRGDTTGNRDAADMW